MLKIANAKVIREFGLNEILTHAKERIKQLDYRVLALSQEKEQKMYKEITD